MSKKLTFERMMELEEYHGTQKEAAAAMGIPKSTWGDWRRAYIASADSKPAAPDVLDLPDIEDDDIGIGAIIDHQVAAYRQKKANNDSWTWAEFGVKDNLPVGLVIFGDIHLDSDGCNWERLKSDLTLTASNPGIHCLNIGDLHNNWVGRLERLYGEQNMSKKRAYRLVKGILTEMGVPWMLHLVGNHDAWGDGMEVLKNMGGKNLFRDWEARVKLTWPDKSEYKIHAAHNFKGSSIYSTTHGAAKKAMFNGDADLYCSGHIHTYGLQSFQLDNKDRCPLIVQARGYKFIDDFALRGGFSQDTVGASVMVVVDPRNPDIAARGVAFTNLEDGLLYLNAKREKARLDQS